MEQGRDVEGDLKGGAGAEGGEGGAGGEGGDGTVYFSSVCSKDGSGQREAPTHQGDLPTLTILLKPWR